ncbi:twin-arginine translocase TatA/TatE family subunit [Thermogymnomonas acidicola]|uniref:Sec-independent protein translocase subunit TatA/TatB n=1 Tax=Thermogymnomonas acidicola TaxID=399579 RepID=UPI0009462149|nr:twin-arginine translocase TatA/TatE family subunit [Thermogymnomonas acidicola]
MISIEEILIIVVVAAILFGGSKKIPELARSIGRATGGEFRRGGQMEIQREIENATRAGAATQTVNVNVVEAARNLGINPEGKSEEELKREIAEKIKN